MELLKKLTSEFLGTATLLTVIVGSGIMGERLSDGNIAIALLGNSISTGLGLVFLIYGFQHISGAHFNPIVTITETVSRRISWFVCGCYIFVQITGAALGVVTANLMFELSAVTLSSKLRNGFGQCLSEFVATFGLIAVIRLGTRFHQNKVGVLVACYITSAYWFTSSTSFANPAVTIARSFSDTFTGIAPMSVPSFLIAQLLGAFAGLFIFDWLLKEFDDN